MRMMCWRDAVSHRTTHVVSASHATLCTYQSVVALIPTSPFQESAAPKQLSVMTASELAARKSKAGDGRKDLCSGTKRTYNGS